MPERAPFGVRNQARTVDPRSGNATRSTGSRSATDFEPALSSGRIRRRPTEGRPPAELRFGDPLPNEPDLLVELPDRLLETSPSSVLTSLTRTARTAWKRPKDIYRTAFTEIEYVVSILVCQPRSPRRRTLAETRQHGAHPTIDRGRRPSSGPSPRIRRRPRRRSGGPSPIGKPARWPHSTSARLSTARHEQRSRPPPGAIRAAAAGREANGRSVRHPFDEDGRPAAYRAAGYPAFAMARRPVVASEQVLAPVVGEVAPDGVDVVGAVLGVVVLDQEARAADRVVVAASGLLGPGPRERDGGQARARDPFPVGRGDVVAAPLEVMADQAFEAVLLGRRRAASWRMPPGIS